MQRSVLILGANSDVAKACIPMYISAGYTVMAASRSTDKLRAFATEQKLSPDKMHILFWDATDFESHAGFYAALPQKPTHVLYAAGFLVQNAEAFGDFAKVQRMIDVHYAGAVSMLNRIAFDPDNPGLQRIVGLSSLSGVRGRRSNFVYGSTKAAFTTYLAGLRQELAPRRVTVNAVISGYIRTKINEGLDLNESLIMEPEFVARQIVRAGNRFRIVPGWKWKIIHFVLRILPEGLVAKLP